MTAVQIEIDDGVARELANLAVVQHRSEAAIIGEALTAYLRENRPAPRGMGAYRSGDGTVSERAREILKQAVQDRQWP